MNTIILNANHWARVLKVNGVVPPIFFFSSMADLESIEAKNITKDTCYAAAIAHGIFKDPKDLSSYMFKVSIGGAEVPDQEFEDGFDGAALKQNPGIFSHAIHCDMEGLVDPYDYVFPESQNAISGVKAHS